MSCLKLMHTVKSLANIFNKINVNSAVQGIIKIQPTASGKRAITIDLRAKIGAEFGSDQQPPQEKLISPPKKN